jgi:chromosome segregation ATPase
MSKGRRTLSECEEDNIKTKNRLKKCNDGFNERNKEVTKCYDAYKTLKEENKKIKVKLDECSLTLSNCKNRSRTFLQVAQLKHQNKVLNEEIKKLKKNIKSLEPYINSRF